MAIPCNIPKKKNSKCLMLSFIFLLIFCEYFVIYKPQTMFRPPKNGMKKDYGPLPNYMLVKMANRLASFQDKERIPEKVVPKPIAQNDEEQELAQDIRPFPGQTEEDQVTLTVDLDELYLKDTSTCIKTILGYFFLLGLELAVIGYVFGYPIYLDRLEYAKFCEREKEIEAEKLEKGKRRLRRAGRRRSKKKLS